MLAANDPEMPKNNLYIITFIALRKSLILITLTIFQEHLSHSNPRVFISLSTLSVIKELNKYG